MRRLLFVLSVASLALCACGSDEVITRVEMSWRASCERGCITPPARSIVGANTENGILVTCSLSNSAGLKTLDFHVEDNSSLDSAVFGIRVRKAKYNSVGQPAGSPECQVTLRENSQEYGPGSCVTEPMCRIVVTEETASDVDGAIDISGTMNCAALPGPDPAIAPFTLGGASGGDATFHFTQCHKI